MRAPVPVKLQQHFAGGSASNVKRSAGGAAMTMDEERRRQIKERQGRIAETLIRAADDPRLRDELLANPQVLFGAESTRDRPEVPDHVQDMRRQIATHLIDTAQANAEFRTQLRADLLGAIRTAGLTPQM